jgi:acyl-CoA thioesterase II
VDYDESEVMIGSLADLVQAITARPLPGADSGPGADDCETFTTTSPMWWGGGRTFGGMVVAQALHAATRTVPVGLRVHSLHGYFLRPSAPGSVALQRVQRVRDGRSFTTREVTTEVEGRTTFRMTCSFHQDEAGDEYQLPLADGVPPPGGIAGFEGPFPFDIREVGATARRPDGTYLSTRRCWFRTRERLPDDPALHACLLAYLSDMTGAAFRPLSLGTWGTHTDASLDHAVWFHRPARADQWSFFDIHTLVNAGGRSTIRATMHNAEGMLHLSMAQEVLIRELEVPVAVEPPPWANRALLGLIDGKEDVTDGTP